MTDIKQVWAKLIETTGNPVAPLIMQEAYASLNRLGSMLAGHAKPEEVNTISSLMLKPWSDAELEGLTKTPEFCMALAAMLSAGLRDYANAVPTSHASGA